MGRCRPGGTPHHLSALHPQASAESGRAHRHFRCRPYRAAGCHGCHRIRCGTDPDRPRGGAPRPRCPVRGKVSDQSEDRRSDGENPGIHKRHALRVRSGSIRCKCRCALHAGCCLPRRADRLYRLATFGNFPADGSVHQKGTGSVRIQKQRRRI